MRILEDTQAIAPYLSSWMPNVHPLFLIVMGGFLISGIMWGILTRDGVKIFGTVMLTLMLTPALAAALDPWSKRVSSALSEMYGVEITAQDLQDAAVYELTLSDHMSLVPLYPEGQGRPVRDPETGIVTSDPSLLYLFVDGKVLEVVTKSGNQYHPYIPGSRAAAGSKVAEEPAPRSSHEKRQEVRDSQSSGNGTSS